MQKFRRRGETAIAKVDHYEVALLGSLVRELVEMVAPDQAGRADTPHQQGRPGEQADDQFALWAAELASPPAARPEDPALLRLFPDAYPEDAQATADFRRYTERELRAGKVRDAEMVLRRLATTGGELRIPKAESDAWLRTLTSLRLTLAVRLGVTDAAAAEELGQVDGDDPRAYLASVYDWLGFAQETLLAVL